MHKSTAGRKNFKKCVKYTTLDLTSTKVYRAGVQLMLELMLQAGEKGMSERSLEQNSCETSGSLLKDATYYTVRSYLNSSIFSIFKGKLSFGASFDFLRDNGECIILLFLCSRWNRLLLLAVAIHYDWHILPVFSPRQLEPFPVKSPQLHLPLASVVNRQSIGHLHTAVMMATPIHLFKNSPTTKYPI